MADENGTFICELVLERYNYLRNTQKRLNITKYGPNKKFLRVFLVYNGLGFLHNFAIKVSVASGDSGGLGVFKKVLYNTPKIAKFLENVSSGLIVIAYLF